MGLGPQVAGAPSPPTPSSHPVLSVSTCNCEMLGPSDRQTDICRQTDAMQNTQSNPSAPAYPARAWPGWARDPRGTSVTQGLREIFLQEPLS